MTASDSTAIRITPARVRAPRGRADRRNAAEDASLSAIPCNFPPYHAILTMVPRFRAKVTSKNQLTLPAGVSALLHVIPGDELTFTVDEASGTVTVAGPSFAERITPWIGRLRGDGPGKSGEEIDAWIREMRGPRDE